MSSMADIKDGGRMPIETAPKDGRVFLVAAATAHLTPHNEHAAITAFYDATGMIWLCNARGFEMAQTEPTRWAPMPRDHAMLVERNRDPVTETALAGIDRDAAARDLTGDSNA